MAISELIANLENLRAEHGDLEVFCNDYEYGMCELKIECEGFDGRTFKGKDLGRKVVKFSRGDCAE